MHNNDQVSLYKTLKSCEPCGSISDIDNEDSLFRRSERLAMDELTATQNEQREKWKDQSDARALRIESYKERRKVLESHIHSVQEQIKGHEVWLENTNTKPSTTTIVHESNKSLGREDPFNFASLGRQREELTARIRSIKKQIRKCEA